VLQPSCIIAFILPEQDTHIAFYEKMREMQSYKCISKHTYQEFQLEIWQRIEQ
jgi:hypothetical protein